MITLERVRLIDWHFFSDEIIPLGNRCLIAGDNGSGKSTIVDAIQYAMAADLRKARFNTAAGDRKGGRDLAGYVRCKLGSDQTEYLRGDAVSHVVLEFSDRSDEALSPLFLAGVCVESWNDNRTSEHFWMAQRPSLEVLETKSPDGRPLSWRQFRDTLGAFEATFYDTKKQYLRDFTARLGVWRRMAEYNPYLEAFTRSVSFSPLTSVDAFVCDYILEERPLDISTMKANLESYKEAEREAQAAKARILALQAIVDQAAEWEKYQRNLTLQEYLRCLLDRDQAKTRHEDCVRQKRDLGLRYDSLVLELEALRDDKARLETERRQTEAALARDDTHQLYVSKQGRVAELEKKVARATEHTERYRWLRGHCAQLLDRDCDLPPPEEIEWLRGALTEETARRERARQAELELDQCLRDVLVELKDLEKGIRRFPAATTQLRQALETAGIKAWVLADIAEVQDQDWANAIEGWLDTLRFALIVAPEDFQKALELYDGLPASVSGVALPNLARMRDTEAKQGSLAAMVRGDNPWAQTYLDYVLGDVMTADLGGLKQYKKAITKDCMSYSGYTAARIDEAAYRSHWLGRSAREQRKQFLVAESLRLRMERDELRQTIQTADHRLAILTKAQGFMYEADHLLPEVAAAERLTVELEAERAELEAIDTSSFGDLEDKIETLVARLRDIEKTIERNSSQLGALGNKIEQLDKDIADAAVRAGDCQQRYEEFRERHVALLDDCERYAADRLRADSPLDILANYDSARKGIITRSDRCLRTFRELVIRYNRDFNALLRAEIEASDTAADLLHRLEASELPTYLEKISRARMDAEREFKDHFIARLNELIEEARESFREINDTLRSMIFGRDQYRFTLEEKSDRRGQIEIVRKAAQIASFEDSLFAQLADPADRQAAEQLFNRILESDLNSAELRSICDYRTYFTYDIKIRDTQSINQTSGRAEESSLSKVLREKSGGEAQTPYYVAIAASFFRFFKDRPDATIRLVLFDEAFDRLDDERIGKILQFFRELNLQVLISVPTEKIEAITPHMNTINLVIRHGYQARVRDFGQETE